MSDFELKYIPLYMSWLPMFERMPPETVRNLIIGSMQYALTGQEPALPDSDMPFFYAIRGNIDSSIKNCEAKSNNGRYAANVRWHGNENDADACDSMQTHAIENEIENEREIENETETEIETEIERTGEVEERKRVQEKKGVRGKRNPRGKENPPGDKDNQSVPSLPPDWPTMSVEQQNEWLTVKAGL